MKTNLPVTGEERFFPAEQALVSRTDTKGVITFANDAFVEASGFTRQELIGASHNIIRHPDVPPVIFETMWATLKQGLPWRGVVKNRCKNGGHYWVDAKVVPVRKNGKTIGYMSVRGRPSREAVAAAEEAYAKAARDPESARGTTATRWRSHFSIKNGVTLGIVFVTLLMIAGGILGITGLNSSNSALRSLYFEEMDPVQAIGRINFLMADNRAQAALALHHNPAAHGPERFDHDVNAHLLALERNKQEIDALWESYAKDIKDTAERDLANKYWQARARYVDEGLLAAKAALERGNYAQAEMLLLARVNPLYDQANAKVGVLLNHLSDRARSSFVRVTERNRAIAAVAVAGISLGSLILVLAGVFFFRATVMPLQKAVGALENIAEGNLTDNVDTDALGEPGRVMAAVMTMQMHLKVMMDEIRQSSGSIREQCRHLNQTMMNLAEQSEEQHDRIYQTLDASQEACNGLDALAANADQLLQMTGGEAAGAVGRGAAVSRSAGDDELFGAPVVEAEGPGTVAAEGEAAGGLAGLAGEVAGGVRIQSFALEDVASQLRQVASLIVQNREQVQGAWAASQQLENTALELDRLVKYFES